VALQLNRGLIRGGNRIPSTKQLISESFIGRRALNSFEADDDGFEKVHMQSFWLALLSARIRGYTGSLVPLLVVNLVPMDVNPCCGPIQGLSRVRPQE
jgi:hypothetical protein